MNQLISQRALISIPSFLIASLFAAPAFANVLVVDASGGGNFTDIQPAIDAASDGDTILVKAGTYGGFSIMNKALAVVGDTGAVVDVEGGIRVRDLDATKSVALVRLQSKGIFGATGGPYGLKATNNLGHVRIERCQLTGANGNVALGAPHGSGGLSATACSDIALQWCTLSGGAGVPGEAPDVGTSGPGAVVVGSAITIYDSSVAGGNGQQADPCHGAPDGGNGGDAFYGDAMTLVASGSTFTGGSGGNAITACGCANQTAVNANAGVALHLGDSFFTVAYLLANAEHGGTTGIAYGQLCNTYFGQQLQPRSGHTFVDFTGTNRTMNSPSPMRESTVGQMVFTGVPGERVALLVADEPEEVLQVPWKGRLLVKTHHPLLSVPMGTIPASGTLFAPSEALDLHGLSSKTLYLQSLFVGPQGQRTLGSASTLVILNQAY